MVLAAVAGSQQTFARKSGTGGLLDRDVAYVARAGGLLWIAHLQHHCGIGVEFKGAASPRRYRGAAQRREQVPLYGHRGWGGGEPGVLAAGEYRQMLADASYGCYGIRLAARLP